MSKGYPTPDNPVGDVTFGCIPVYVPNNPEFQEIFAAAIYGLYATMSKEYFWRDFGTMSASEAAFLSARGLAVSQAYDGSCGDAMSCDDIADCIETDTLVQDAIETTIVNNGFVPNPETSTEQNPPPSLSSSSKTENLLPDTFSEGCEGQEAIAMGLARTIVKELHESAEDLFEIIEYATNTAEAYASMSELIPVVGDSVSAAFEFVDWVLETLAETYQASYNQSVEDELSCMIFCHIMDTCSLSINDLVSLYESKGTITLPPTDDLAAIFTFAIETALSASVTTVAIFHYQILRLLSWGNVAGFSAPYLKSLLSTNVSASDYSYEDLCEDCVEAPEPTAYWALYLDLRISQRGTETVIVNGNSNDGSYVGNGYRANMDTTATTTNANFGYPDLGASYVTRAFATRSVRRGSTGNGTNDFAQFYNYAGANYSGANALLYNHNFIAGNTNDVVSGVINPTQVGTTRSFHIRSRVNKSVFASPLPELRVYELVVWGLAGAGNTKPPGAYWAGNSLPGTLADLFPT